MYTKGKTHSFPETVSDVPELSSSESELEPELDPDPEPELEPDPDPELEPESELEPELDARSSSSQYFHE